MELMYQKNQIYIKSNQLVFCIIADSLAAFNVVSSQWESCYGNVPYYISIDSFYDLSTKKGRFNSRIM